MKPHITQTSIPNIEFDTPTLTTSDPVFPTPTENKGRSREESLGDHSDSSIDVSSQSLSESPEEQSTQNQ